MNPDLNNNVRYLRDEYRKSPIHDKGHKGGGGGGSGDGGDMEKRIETLEKAIPDIRERLVRVETRLESIEKNMVTKADIAAFATRDDLQKISVDVLKAINDQTWRFITVAGVLAGLAFTAARFIPGG